MPAAASTTSSTLDLLGGLSLGGVESKPEPDVAASPPAAKPLFKGVPLTTQQYGGQWGVHAKEGKVQVASGSSIQDIAERISTRTGLHTVQILTKLARLYLRARLLLQEFAELPRPRRVWRISKLTIRTKNMGLTQLLCQRVPALLS